MFIHFISQSGWLFHLNCSWGTMWKSKQKQEKKKSGKNRKKENYLKKNINDLTFWTVLNRNLELLGFTRHILKKRKLWQNYASPKAIFFWGVHGCFCQARSLGKMSRIDEDFTFGISKWASCSVSPDLWRCFWLRSWRYVQYRMQVFIKHF